MTLFKTKKIASLITMILMLSIACSMAIAPPADAAQRVYKNMAYLSLAPVVIGEGQNVIITFWCDKLPPTALGDYGDRFYFDVNVMKPDGTNDTFTGIESDPVGAGYCNYVPEEPGTYTVQAIMLQHVIDGGKSRGLLPPFFTERGAGWWPSGTPPSGANAGFDPIGVVFESALSEPVTLTVTTEQVPRYIETPLPNDYWSRPVYDTNRGWGPVVMGQYLGASELTAFGNARYNPYTTGPTSAHVLWTRPFFNGGVAGGYSTVNSSSADNSYYSGQSYEQYGGPSIIMNGKFYYSVGTNPKEGWYCCDLYSGETIYFRNNTQSAVSGAGGSFSSTGSIPSGAPAFGQILVEDNPNQHGTISYYWVTSPIGKTNTWEMYDDFSGNYICSIGNTTWIDVHSGRNVTKGATGTSAVGVDGSILRYNFVNLGSSSAPKYCLQIWNTSQVIMYAAYQAHDETTGSNSHWMWRPNLNYTYDGRNGLSANVSIPSLTLGTINIRQIIPDDKLLIIYPGSNNGSVNIPGSVWAINLKPGSVGQVLYSYNFTAPANVGDAYGQNEQYSNKNTNYGGINEQEGIFWFYDAMTRRYFIYDITTGNQLWTAPPSEQFQFYGGATAVCYKGKFIDCGGYSGVVRAFDAKTGTSLWNWSAPTVGLDETPYQHSPTSFGFLTGDGQLYLYSSEHSNNNPIRRDAQLWDVNVTDGKMIWMLTNWPSTAPIVADQRLLVVDSHDEMIYCFGKGPSATTVSVPQTVPALGSSVQLLGTVTDQSQYGRRNINGGLDRPLKGTPAIADSSMTAWMEYMFHQRPMPTNATGVPIRIETIDPNGNFVHVGDTVSDEAGNWGLAYTPEVPGTYKIIAYFDGSNSYGPSFATSYLTVVDSQESSTPTTTPLANSVADLYLIPATIGIIVAIAIATLVIVLALRKRP